MNITKMSGFATSSGLGERECPVCGKPFSPTVQHIYKAGKSANRKFVCSYTCQRAWEKNPDVLKKSTEQKGKYGNNKVPVRVVETGEVFDTIVACARSLNVSASTVYNCIHSSRTINSLHIEKGTK